MHLSLLLKNWAEKHSRCRISHGFNLVEECRKPLRQPKELSEGVEKDLWMEVRLEQKVTWRALQEVRLWEETENV